MSIRWRFWEHRSATPSVFANGGVAAGGNISNSPITIRQADNTEVLEQGNETQDLLRQLLARFPQTAPGAEIRVGQAVEEITRGARKDRRLQNALDLLRAKKIAEASRLLRDIAEDRAARIARDRKEAAAAYRHLGAIEGLGNPREALEAYQKAIEFDPEDTESLLWAASLEVEREQLDDAERHFRRVITLEGMNEAGPRYWALLGLGDIHQKRGNMAAALKSYQASHSITERLAETNPGNAGWQRDLAISCERIGAAQKAQGNLADALKSYRASHAIFARLAGADRRDADAHRSLSVSHIFIGDMQTVQGSVVARWKAIGPRTP